MENRKNVVLAVLILAGLSITTQQTVAYHIETHALLTQKAYETYVRAHPENQLSQELLAYMLEGARREDDPPRWLNHFYDPVKDRGLSYDPAIDPINIGTWEKSKDWAQDSFSQTELAYSPVIATILSAIQSGKIQKYFPTSDFTWNRALRYWIQGDKEMGMLALGHIVHLIEDITVPDHTRNDNHADGSPYETYTENFNIDTPDYTHTSRNASLAPRMLPDLDAYFTELATYTNNNFYSKDTMGIQSGYDKPVPTGSTRIGPYIYGTTQDQEHNDILLYVQKGKEGIITNEAYISLNNNLVMDSYWDILSEKAVSYGAGVIDLFFKEAQRNKNNPEFLTEKKNFIGQIIEFAQDTINSIFGNNTQEQDILTVPLPTQQATPPQTHTNTSNTPSYLPLPSPTQKSSPTPTYKISPKPPTPTPSKKPTPPQTSPPPKASPSAHPNTCIASIYARAAYIPVLISEVAWMGTVANAADEWIELQNISNQPINLAGWGLKTGDKSADITFPNLTIPAQGYILLERTDDTSLPGVQADLIYSGSLANTQEQLYLFDASCKLIDAISDSSWPAGNAPSRKTMERNPSTKVWYTSSFINGTPRQQNSPQTAGGGGGSGVSTAPVPSPSPNTSPTPGLSPNPTPSLEPTTSPQPSPSPVFSAIEINEIYYDAPNNDEDREWIEIYNADSQAVDIANWRLHENDTMHFLLETEESVIIEPGLYIIIAQDETIFQEEFPEYTGTVLRAAFTLNNESDSLALYNNDLLIDNTSYEMSLGANGNTYSLQKVEEQWCQGPPTPGNPNACGQPPEETTEEDRETLTLEYLASAADTPEEERDLQRFAPQLAASWQGEDLQEGEQWLLEEVSDPTNPLELGFSDADYYRFPINEIGRLYTIRATRIGEETAATSSYQGTLEVPGYVSKLTFSNQNNPTIELTYQKYPFIPDIFSGSKYPKLVIFSLNNDPIKNATFHAKDTGNRLSEEWTQDMLAHTISVTFKRCNGNTTTLRALVLGNGETCPTSQSFMQNDQIKPTSLEIHAIKEEVGTLSSQDYLMVSYYTLGQSSAGGQTYYLAATDKTKYYFQE